MNKAKQRLVILSLCYVNISYSFRRQKHCFFPFSLFFLFILCLVDFGNMNCLRFPILCFILHLCDCLVQKQVVKLKAFSKFENTSEALSAATLLIDSKPSKGLRKFLKAHCDGETLGVADSKLGNAIKEKLVSSFFLVSAHCFLV